MMAGGLGLSPGAREHLLKSGESIHFDSDVSHKRKHFQP